MDLETHMKRLLLYLSCLVPALAAAQKAPAARDISALDLAVDDARLLVIDESERRTGLDTASGQEIREIPQSGVWEDQIDNDLTGEPATSMDVQVSVERPAEGTYRIIVVRATGKACGTLICYSTKTFELAVDVFAVDGSPEPPMRVRIDLIKTPRAEFRLHVLKAPRSKSRLERISEINR